MILIHKSITNTFINYIYWRKTKTKVKLNSRKLSFFRLKAPEDGIVEENEKFYDQLQEILY
jgi:hypothetical protein